MLSESLAIYLVAELRDLARQEKATVRLEEQKLVALEKLKLHHPNGISNTSVCQFKEANVVEFVDTNAEKELVHAIVVNDSQKRITIVFRGSLTTTNFFTNAKYAHTEGRDVS